MKKLLNVFVFVAFAILFSACADNKTINGTTYRPYGFINESTCKNDSIQYEICGPAVFSGILFCEIIVPPIYVFGYNLYEPIGLKKDFVDGGKKGVVK